MFKLVSDFEPAGDQPGAIAGLSDGLDHGLAKQTLLGVTGSGKTFSMASIIAKQQRPAMILAPNKTLAAQLYGEMKRFFPDNAVEYFVSYYDYYQPEAYVPSSDLFIEKDASINEHIEQMRLSATKSILEREDVIIVATVSAIYGLGDPDAYLSMRLMLKTGDVIERHKILHRLADMQYSRNDVAFERGTYRARGDTIDIFPADSEQLAMRVSLFDEDIEQLSWFDPLTGKTVKKVPTAVIYPKSHYVTPRDRVLRAIEAIKTELTSQLSILRTSNLLVEAQRLAQRTQHDLEMLNELGYCTGIENYARHLTAAEPGSPPPTLMSYLPNHALLFIDESHVTIPQLGAMWRGDRARKENLVRYGFRLPSALDNRPLSFEEFEALMPQTIFVSATPGDYEVQHADAQFEQVVRPTGLVDPEIIIRPVNTQVEDVLSEIQTCVQKQQRVLITTLTKKMSESLTGYLSEHGVRVRYLHSDIDTVERSEILRDLRLGTFDVLVGINLLREGLDLPEVGLVAIFDADKEGFLRSTRALIQTVGRAARHLEGRAILYADKMTRAMRSALDEMTRRREKQTHYNTVNHIIPKAVSSTVLDVMSVRAASTATSEENLSESQTEAFEHIHSLQSATRELKKLEKQMKKHVELLEFEQAADCRDQIKALKRHFLI